MKTALICGVSGQDGAYLAQLLLDKGYVVHGTSRDCQISSFANLKTLNIYDKISFHSMAVNDFRSVLSVLKKTQADEVYNLSGQSSVGLSFEQPVETLESIGSGTLNILEAIRFMDKPIRFYNAGSSECFGDTNGEPATELTPFRPRSPYAIAKSTAFWEVANYREAYGVFACTGILFNHESPLRPERFVTQKIIATTKRIANGSHEKLILGNINIARDWGWAPEYVKAMWLMLQHPKPDDYIVCTGKTVSLQHFIELTFKQFNLDWQKHIKINHDLSRPTDLMMSCGNPQKVFDKLGWRATTYVEDVVKYMCK